MFSALFNAGNLLAQLDYDYDLYSTSGDAAASAGLLAFTGGFWLICCCVFFLVNLALAYLVYSDAKKNNADNGMLWAVVTFFLPLIGLLVYFLAIRPQAIEKKGGNSAKVVEGKEVEKK